MVFRSSAEKRNCGLSPNSFVKFTTEADESTKGPASFMIADPDGNTLLFDQHVPSPKR